MQAFDFEVRTRIHFGEGKISVLPEEVKRYGNHIFFLYDEIPAKVTGAYEAICKLCGENGIKITEFTGIEPNPRYTTVDRAVAVLKECKADVIVALGGGSTIDTAKAMSFSVFYEGSCWDFYTKKAKIEKTMPVISIPTTAASGAEISNVSVISNMETKSKLDVRHDLERPVAMIADPTYTYSLPPFQTALGIVDIMAHSFEGYFSSSVGSIQDGFSEIIQKTCIDHGRKVMICPKAYESRAQLLWASGLAITHLQDQGRNFTAPVHNTEHIISAFFDIPHAAGIAILSVAWFKYILNDETVGRLARWGRNVWSIDGNLDEYTIANKAIEAYEAFLKELKVPTRLRELKTEIPEESLQEMAGALYPSVPAKTWFKPLNNTDEMADFLRLAY